MKERREKDIVQENDLMLTVTFICRLFKIKTSLRIDEPLSFLSFLLCSLLGRLKNTCDSVIVPVLLHIALYLS